MAGASQKLYRQIVEELSAAIDQGHHAVGARLPSERELSERFGVSRPTVREAMIALEMQGIVAARHGSGVYVTALPGGRHPDLDIGAFELAEARRMVESETAALAATMIDTGALAELEACLVSMSDPDAGLAVAADREFHLVVARATGNDALVACVTMLWDMRDRSPLAHRIYTHGDRGGLTKRIEEHRVIIAALAAHDPAGARTGMRNHLARVIDHLLEATETEAVARVREEARLQRDRLRERAI